MIKEKPLERRAQAYASGVVSALVQTKGPRVLPWAKAKGLIEAAYFNGFQSGVVWQKKVREEEDDRPYRVERVEIEVGNGRVTEMETAVTEGGAYIGSPAEAKVLWKGYGITQFELRTKKSKVCSVGYSPTKAQWFGWSHRAIRGFKTRREASKFAESVS